eukprot:m.262547 g.262547  ORF g.262547 m.262547 type:complete len:452 (-) comp16005_c0_seq1:2178-3533(-)
MMMGEAMGGGGPLEPEYHSISGTERSKQLAAVANANSESVTSDSAPRRLIEAADAVLVDVEYVRPIRERHDAVRELGFSWETARLRDGSAVAVVCEVRDVGLCTQRYAAASAVELYRGNAPTIERGDVIIRLNTVVLAEEEGALLPALLSKAGELDRLSVRVLRAKPAAMERVIEHGLAAVSAARVQSTLVAEVAAAAVPPPPVDPAEAQGAEGAAGAPPTPAEPVPFMAAVADALGLGPPDETPSTLSKRKYERARAHALLSRELAIKVNELRAGGGDGGAAADPHPSSAVWLALASFGLGADDAIPLCRAALATEAGASRRLELHSALARASASARDLTGAREQLWLEAAAAETASPRNQATIIRCLFDMATVADHEAAAAAGISAAWEPLDPKVAELYRKCLAEGKRCDCTELPHTHRQWLAAAATKISETAPAGCAADDESWGCRLM